MVPPTVTSQVTRSGNSINVTVQGSATDNVGVVKMDVLLNGEPVFTSTNRIVTMTVRLSSRTNTIQVRAFDQAGNIGSGSVHTVVR